MACKRSLVLFLTCFLALGSILALASDSSIPSKRVAYNQVFSTGEQSLEPSKTLDLLKRLIETDPSSDEENQADAQYRDEQRIVSLVEASNLSKFNCMRGRFLSIRSLRNANAQYPNIVRYLNHYKNELFSTCKEKFARLLREEVQELSNKERKQVMMLEKSIVAANGDTALDPEVEFYVPRRALEQGITEFIQKRAGPRKLRVSNKNQFRQEFEGYVGGLCGSIKQNLASSIQVYEALMVDEDLLSKMDDFELAWLAKSRICNTILTNISSIFSNVYDSILKKKFNKSPERQRRLKTVD